MGRDNNFNLLRFGLAVLVILAHSPELIDGDRHREILTRLFGTLSFGEVAVDGFFLLSGFLILQSWQRSPSLPGYLLKRVTRIYPGFLMASLVCAVVVGPLGADPGRYFAGMNWPKFVQEALKLQMPLVPPVFQGTPHPYVNGAMWTISCEFRCYMLVGLLGVCGLAGRRAVWLALALVALGGTLVLGPPKQATTQGLVRLLIGQPEELVRLAAYFAAGACFFLGRDQIPLKAKLGGGRGAFAGALPVPPEDRRGRADRPGGLPPVLVRLRPDPASGAIPVLPRHLVRGLPVCLAGPDAAPLVHPRDLPLDDVRDRPGHRLRLRLAKLDLRGAAPASGGSGARGGSTGLPRLHRPPPPPGPLDPHRPRAA